MWIFLRNSCIFVSWKDEFVISQDSYIQDLCWVQKIRGILLTKLFGQSKCSSITFQVHLICCGTLSLIDFLSRTALPSVFWVFLCFDLSSYNYSSLKLQHEFYPSMYSFAMLNLAIKSDKTTLRQNLQVKSITGKWPVLEYTVFRISCCKYIYRGR